MYIHRIFEKLFGRARSYTSICGSSIKIKALHAHVKYYIASIGIQAPALQPLEVKAKYASQCPKVFFKRLTVFIFLVIKKEYTGPNCSTDIIMNDNNFFKSSPHRQ